MKTIAFLAFACLLIGQTVAVASEPDEEFLEWNAEADRASCPIGPTAVWVRHLEGEDCMRYFASGDLSGAPLVFVRMYGDRSATMRKPIAEIANNTAKDQRAVAERRSRQLGLPVIILARPGTYGSSGDHGKRRQIREFLAINAAVEEIKRKYEIRGFVLSGHSGGATAVGALLTFGRDDVTCAIMTSGAFGLLERSQRRRERRGESPLPGVDGTGLPNPYDPLNHVSGVVNDPERKIVLIGNRQDTNTPFDLQKRFKKSLEKSGHQVVLLEYPAKAPDYHNLVGAVGYTAIEYCSLHLPGEAARQVPDQSTTVWVESYFTGKPHPRGALFRQD